MTAHGVPWSRVSVEKLENGRRGSITLQELLALALVLNVAPITLIADPRHDADVPVAKDLTVSPWDALMWLAGSGTINRSESSGDKLGRDAWLIQAGWAMVEAVEELGSVDRRILQLDDEDERRERDDDRHRQALRLLNTAAGRVTAQGAPLPDFLPLDQIRRRAAELDVDLVKPLREA
jgi:transcriptional regulator with XRE-family HTH domain